MTQTPAIDGWFTTGSEPALVGSQCTSCGCVFFPRTRASAATRRAPARRSRTSCCPAAGRVWSYTDAQYQPPPPYIPVSDPFEPFALAAVELPEGLIVLGQVAAGYGVDDLHVGQEAELVVETLYTDDDGERTIWRWIWQVVEMGEEADQ